MLFKDFYISIYILMYLCSCKVICVQNFCYKILVYLLCISILNYDMFLILIYIYVGFFLMNLLLVFKQIVINIFKKFEIKINVESRMEIEDNIYLFIL